MTGSIEQRVAFIERMLGIDGDGGRPLMAPIVADAARIFGVPVAKAMGEARDLQSIRARFAAIWVLRRLRPDLSLRRLAEAVGRSEHQTVLHALRRADQLRASEPDFLDGCDRVLAAAQERTKQ